jgi:hypothetical protein
MLNDAEDIHEDMGDATAGGYEDKSRKAFNNKTAI